MSDILPPCDLPDIGFGAMPLAVAATSVAVAGVMIVVSARRRGIGVIAATLVALAVVGVVAPPKASAAGPRNCRTVLPSLAEIPESDLVVIAPGSTVPDEGDTVIVEPPAEPVAPDSSDTTAAD